MFLEPIVHTGPTLSWWLSLHAEEQGVWFSGIMSLLAVCVALWLATRETRLRHADKRDLASIFAPAIYQELRVVRFHCAQIILIDKQRRADLTVYRDMFQNLNAIDSAALDLVAARDIFRGDVGRALMIFYGALLRMYADRKRWPDPSESIGPAGAIFGAAHITSCATDLYAKCDRALHAIWMLTPEPREPIPDANLPYG